MPGTTTPTSEPIAEPEAILSLSSPPASTIHQSAETVQPDFQKPPWHDAVFKPLDSDPIALAAISILAAAYAVFKFVRRIFF